MARLSQLALALAVSTVTVFADEGIPPRLQWWPPSGRSGPVATGRRWNHGPEPRELFPACHMDPFDATNATHGCKVAHGGVLNSWTALGVDGRGVGQDEDGWRTVFGARDPAGEAAEKAERELAKAKEDEARERASMEDDEDQGMSEEEEAKMKAEVDAEELSSVLRVLGDQVLTPRLPPGGKSSATPCRVRIRALSARRLELRHTTDAGRTWAVSEMAVRQDFGVLRFLFPVTFGINYYIKGEILASEGCSPAHVARVAGAAAAAAGGDRGRLLLFDAVVSMDREGARHVFHFSARHEDGKGDKGGQHQEKEKEKEKEKEQEVEVDAASGEATPKGNTKTQVLRLLNFNVWNTNPGAWIFGGNERTRWTRYRARAAAVSGVVRKADADIVGLQEVRLDSTLGGGHAADKVEGSHSVQSRRFQLAHILGDLSAAQRAMRAKERRVEASESGSDDENEGESEEEKEEEEGEPEVYPHWTFQAGMTYGDQNRPDARVEEGVALLSRHAIVSSSYLLLSRSGGDPTDSHQRACLHTAVRVPGWGVVDVFNVHMALSETARDRAALEIMSFIRTNATGVTQIIMGDMNAEPGERAIRYLLGDPDATLPRPRRGGGGGEGGEAKQAEERGEKGEEDEGKSEAEGSVEGGGGGGGRSLPPAEAFVDAFLAAPGQHNVEPARDSKDPIERREALTFPSDNPQKRIDFLLVRGKGAQSVQRAWLLGQDAVNGVRGAAEIPRGGDGGGGEAYTKGMSEPDSPVWPSDHRALAVVLEAEVE